MKLFAVALLSLLMSGCTYYCYYPGDNERVANARNNCAYRGYPQIRIETNYDGSVSRIFCSMERY